MIPSPKRRRLIQFFKLPTKFTRIIDGQTNECTLYKVLCVQMVYGSIHIDEKTFEFTLTIECYRILKQNVQQRDGPGKEK